MGTDFQPMTWPLPLPQAPVVLGPADTPRRRHTQLRCQESDSNSMATDRSGAHPLHGEPSPRSFTPLRGRLPREGRSATPLLRNPSPSFPLPPARKRTPDPKSPHFRREPPNLTATAWNAELAFQQAKERDDWVRFFVRAKEHVTAHPEDASILLLLARAYLAINDVMTAERYTTSAENALADGQSAVTFGFELQVFRAKLRVQDRRFAEAQEILEAALEDSWVYHRPGSAEARMLLAESLFMQGRDFSGRAEVEYQAALTEGRVGGLGAPEKIHCCMRLSELQHAKNPPQPMQALAFLRKAYVLDSRHPRVLCGLVEFGKEQHMPDLMDYYAQRLAEAVPVLPLDGGGSCFEIQDPGRFSRSRKVHEEFQKNDGLLKRALLLLGGNAYNQKEFALGLRYLREARRMWSSKDSRGVDCLEDFLWMHRLSMDCSAQLGLSTEALHHAEHILRLSPEDSAALLVAAEQSRQVGDLERARDYLKRALHNVRVQVGVPLGAVDEDEAASSLARELLLVCESPGVDDLLQQEKCLEILWSQQPTASPLLRKLGIVQLRQNKKLSAEMSFRRCIELDPRDTTAVIKLAGLLCDKIDWHGALELLERIEVLKSHDLEYLEMYAEICLKLVPPKFDKALALYTSAVHVNPVHVKALAKIAEIQFVHAKDLTHVVASLNRVLVTSASALINPRTGSDNRTEIEEHRRNALVTLAEIHLGRDDVSSALELVREASSLRSDDYHTGFLFALLLLRTADFSAAAAAAQRAANVAQAKRESGNASAALGLQAQALERMDSLGAAAFCAAKAIEQDSMNVFSLLTEAWIVARRLEMKGLSSAIAKTEMALALAPDHPMALIQWAYLTLVAEEQVCLAVTRLENAYGKMKITNVDLRVSGSPAIPSRHPSSKFGECKLISAIGKWQRNFSRQRARDPRTPREDPDGTTLSSFMDEEVLDDLQRAADENSQFGAIWMECRSALRERRIESYGLDDALKGANSLHLLSCHIPRISMVVRTAVVRLFGGSFLASPEPPKTPPQTALQSQRRCTPSDPFFKFRDAPPNLQNPFGRKSRDPIERMLPQQHPQMVPNFSRDGTPADLRIDAHVVLEAGKDLYSVFEDRSSKHGHRHQYLHEYPSTIARSPSPRLASRMACSPQRPSQSPSVGRPCPIGRHRTPEPVAPLTCSQDENILARDGSRRRPITPKMDRGIFHRQQRARNRGREVLRIPVSLPPDKILKRSDFGFGKCLGTGGFGSVYEGAMRRDQRKVAIKKLHLNAAGMTPGQWRELIKEIEAYYKLSHTSLVEFIGSCFDPQCFCIVTELCSNGSLHALLHAQKAVDMSWSQRRKIAIQMCDGVKFLHTSSPKVVHRDLKSLNIVIDSHWNAKICDFGLTTWMEMEKSYLSIKDGNNGGSPRYMAPECYISKAKITEKVDIWATGCILIEIFGGPVPFADCTEIQHVVTKLLVEKQGPKIPAKFSPQLRNLIAGCLEFDFQRRWDIIKILNALLDLPE